MLYRYHQTGEFTPWLISEDVEPSSAWAFAEKHKATRITILTVSQDIDLVENRDSLRYSGDLYFDIDDKDLNIALQSGRQLCAKLKALDVAEDDIEIHLSGSKGAHVYVNAAIFSKDKDYEFLAETYAKLAMRLWVDGLDFQVYSAGKGRMVRPPNGMRPDGRFKVQVTYQEFMAVTPENYRDYVKTARPLIAPGKRKWASKLSKVFEGCRVGTLRNDKKDRAVPDSVMAKLGTVVPDCVEMLAQGKKLKAKSDAATSFNQMALQVGCWSKSTLVETPILESLHERIAQHNPSSSGESQAQRVRRLQSMHLYLKTQEKYTFSCGAIKRLIDGAPKCNECPVYAATAAPNALLDSLFLYEHMGHYYGDKEKTQLLAPFTLRRECIVIDAIDGKVQSTVMLVSVPMSGNTFKIKDFRESAWESKQNLKKELSGLDGVGFFGNDNEVSKLRMTLFRDDLLSGAEVNQVSTLSKMGLSYERRAGPENARDAAHRGRLVYIEPGWSLNDIGVPDTHILVGSHKGAPHMKIKDFNVPIGDKGNEAFALLTKINEPHLIATMVGWFFATHLKSHIFKLENKFPLLCVSGVAGTGKNCTIAVLMRLCGIEGESACITLEAPNATKLPFQLALSNSTTIPRIINEMNPKSVHRNHYLMLLEMLKAAFDGQSIEKGTVGGGDRGGANVSVAEWKITSPLVSLSEEPIGSPAVLQRAVMIDMTYSGMRKGEAAFMQLDHRADDLADIGRVLIREALGTDMAMLVRILDSTHVPEIVSLSGLPPRLKFGYKVILTGFNWAIEVLKDSGLTEENYAAIVKMRADFMEYISGSIDDLTFASSITEVDRILKDIALMAHQSASTEYLRGWSIQKGIHFAVHEGLLYLDIITIYPLLQMFKRSQDTRLSIVADEAFLKLAKSMEYFVSDKAVTNILPLGGRTVLSLDMALLAEKSVPVEMFL